MNRSQEIAVDILITEEHIEDCLDEYKALDDEHTALSKKLDELYRKMQKCIGLHSKYESKIQSLKSQLSEIERQGSD